MDVCVVCGTDENLGIHHVFPNCYFKYMPKYKKERGEEHDLLPLCKTHHDYYEDYAWKLKKKLMKEFDAPFTDPKTKEQNETLDKLYSPANALKNLKDRIPPKRQEYLRAKLRSLLGKDPTKEDIDTILEQRAERARLNKKKKSSYHGQTVMHKLDWEGIDDLAIRWRTHFLQIMKPNFMPEGWDKNIRIYAPRNKDYKKAYHESAD